MTAWTLNWQCRLVGLDVLIGWMFAWVNRKQKIFFGLLRDQKRITAIAIMFVLSAPDLMIFSWLRCS